MYRIVPRGQLSFENFYLPFGGKLSSENRWVKLAKMIPWEGFEQEYAQQFCPNNGAIAKPFRIALGSLIIKEKLGTSDEETVAQIIENPYLQYFLGLSEYQGHAPFDASMMVHFRKRVGLELIAAINEAVVEEMLCEESCGEQDCQLLEEASIELQQNTASAVESSSDNDDDESSPLPNDGQLLLDATCAPADIRYPTDLGLLHEAREWSEQLLDTLYAPVQGQMSCKPRTYRQVARRRYLAIVKKRKPSRRLLRKGIGQQLRYLRRNLAHIDGLLDAGADLTTLSAQHYRMLLVIHELYRQQQEMYETRTHRIEHRIVSLSQPHVRPIVRGKARTPVEFGAKLAVSCVRGCVFLDHLSWENFNESTLLIQQSEAFREHFGHYPASIHADRVYRTRANLRWCKDRGIRLSGPPLGRPPSNDTMRAHLKQQAREDEVIRVEIEGKFGQAKRRFSLARVMAKLAQTAATSIAITILVLNLERWMRCLYTDLLLLFAAVFILFDHLERLQHSLHRSARHLLNHYPSVAYVVCI